MAPDFKTLTEAILSHVDGSRSAPARSFHFIGDTRARRPEKICPIDQLVRASLALSTGLHARNVGRGDVVFIALPTSEDFLIAFMGIVLAGALPCAVPEEEGSSRVPFSDHVRQAALRFRPRMLISTAAICGRIGPADSALWPEADTVQAITADGDGRLGFVYRPVPDELLHLQLTSGSTAAPKAAALSHRAVVANMLLTAGAGRTEIENHRGLIWLPLFHDMGLISALSAVFFNCDIFLQAPGDFILNPIGWLKNISTLRCTTTAVPNFALAYCVRRFRPDLIAGSDLSCLDTVVVGAEKVHLPTLRSFASTFSAVGFSADAFYPCYGCAELTLAVTMPASMESRGVGQRVRWDCAPSPIGSGPGQLSFDPSNAVVGLGTAFPGSVLRIRDKSGAELGEERVGEVFVSSPCLMDGYYLDEESTRAVLRDGEYATGDWGYLKDGELYLIGRKSELIILRGRNYPPQEFEQCAASLSEVGVDQIAAFGVPDPIGGSEKLVLALELDEYRELGELRLRIQSAMRSQFGFGASDVCFVRRGGIPRTTSRKIRRLECASMYSNGELSTLDDAHATAALITGNANGIQD